MCAHADAAASVPVEQVWNFIDDFRDPAVGGEDIQSLPEYFLRNGYATFGTGKVFHPGR